MAFGTIDSGVRGARRAVPPSPAAGARRPRAVLVDVYGTLLRVEALRRHFAEVGRPEHEVSLFLAHVERVSLHLALTGSAVPFAEVVGEAVRAATGGGLDDDGVRHLAAGLTDLPRHPDADPAFAVLARSRVPAWAVAQGSGEFVAGSLDANGLRSFLRGTIATDDLGALPPHPDGYRLACAAARIEPSTTAFVSAHPYLVHGAMKAGLVGGLVQRRGTRTPTTTEAPHVRGATLVEVAESLLALPG